MRVVCWVVAQGGRRRHVLAAEGWLARPRLRARIQLNSIENNGGERAARGARQLAGETGWWFLAARWGWCFGRFGGVREFKGIYSMRLDHSAKCRASKKKLHFGKLFDGMKSVALHATALVIYLYDILFALNQIHTMYMYIYIAYDQLLVCDTLTTSAPVFKILPSVNESIDSDLPSQITPQLVL
jgi:hypothetical protein